MGKEGKPYTWKLLSRYAIRLRTIQDLAEVFTLVVLKLVLKLVVLKLHDSLLISLPLK